MLKFLVACNEKRIVAIPTDHCSWGIDGSWYYLDYKRALETFQGRFKEGDIIPWNNSLIFFCEAEGALDAVDKFRKACDEQLPRGHI